MSGVSYAVLAGLTGDERALVDALLEERELASGETLFREGEESDGLVLVEKGTLRVTSERAGDLGTVESGGSLGGIALVAVGQREVSAVAEGRARVRLLPRAAFRRLVDDAPRVSCRVLESCLVEFAGVAREMLDRMAFRKSPESEA